MLNATLSRFSESDQGTFGDLVVNGQSWRTGELPWRQNLPDQSRIDVGTYTCALRFSPHFQRTIYHLLDVPGRGDVEIHWGNFCGDKAKGFRSDVLGCILVGDSMGVLDGQLAVLNSVAAFDRFLAATQGQILVLTIQDNWQSGLCAD